MPFRVNPRRHQTVSGLAISFVGVLNRYGVIDMGLTRHVVTLFQFESIRQSATTFRPVTVSNQGTAAVRIA